MIFELLNNIPKYSVNECKDMRNESFERGYKAGKRDAIDCLIDKQKYYCKNLDELEKAKVMQFLEENNLEFGYDFQSGGFYVFKKLTK